MPGTAARTRSRPVASAVWSAWSAAASGAAGELPSAGHTASPTLRVTPNVGSAEAVPHRDDLAARLRGVPDGPGQDEHELRGGTGGPPATG